MRNLTNTERRIYHELLDGESHSRKDIAKLLPDDLGVIGNARQHVFNINKKLKDSGDSRAILSVYTNKGIHYRLVQLLNCQEKIVKDITDS